MFLNIRTNRSWCHFVYVILYEKITPLKCYDNYSNFLGVPMFWLFIDSLLTPGPLIAEKSKYFEILQYYYNNCIFYQKMIWAISWDYGTFHPPQTHSSNTHVQPSSGARCLIFGRILLLLPYFVCANSEGSGETVQMHRLAWAFAGRLCDKYQNLMSRLK